MLPLVLSPGTSITCDTAGAFLLTYFVSWGRNSCWIYCVADAATRIKATGAKRALGLEPRAAAVAPPACVAKQARSDFPELAKRIAQTDLPAVAQSWNSLCVRFLHFGLSLGVETNMNLVLVD